MSSNGNPAPEMVTLTIDGKSVTVPKGTNVIEAARTVGIDIPYYCYHPDLSVVGNCRMCQCEVKGQPKLNIACNTQVSEGMEVMTQHTSKKVEDSQAATLEFILINHPLDCTVCDQAGHCKLQDYHYDYNARPSRFVEEKEHKVKAEPLGPTVMLDGERCIMCTRCIRFCDEVTGTSELGMLNRGDRSVIAVHPGKELDNPLSGTVVDLCPVGALTHREWRFNTRIWFTRQSDSICPGCSTGCNSKVAVRDREVVQVKGRYNPAVNKEWMCDEGRYGYPRFLPEERVFEPRVDGRLASHEQAFLEARTLTQGRTAVLVAPDLYLEEYAIIKAFVDRDIRGAEVAVAYRERPLTDVERILVSPDYAPNFRGAEFAGFGTGDLNAQYEALLARIRNRDFQNVLLVGDRSILAADLDEKLSEALKAMKTSVAIVTDARSPLVPLSKVVLPGRSVLEKAGLLVNRTGRLQYSDRVVDFPQGTEPDWRLVNKIASRCGGSIVDVEADRDLTIAYLGQEKRLFGLRIATIKKGGVDLTTFRPGDVSSESLAGATSLA